MRARLLPLVLVCAVLALPACEDTAVSPDPDRSPLASMGAPGTTVVDLGRELYFDKSLSRNGNQSCAECHAPDFGFSGPKVAINKGGAVYAGSFRQRFGDRRPPTSSYATVSPNLHYDAGEGLWIGGNFWDGRATGWVLGNPAADQAVGPFLNPVEQALPDAACVIWRVREGTYADAWRAVYGDAIDGIAFPEKMNQECRKEAGEAEIPLSPGDRALVDALYGDVGRAIAAFEGSPEVNAFSSKYDAWKAGGAELTELEEWGFALFDGKAKCSACHVLDLADPGDLLTDFTYDNLGVPANPANPIYDRDPGFVDLGLGGFLTRVAADPTGFAFLPDAGMAAATAAESMGKQKVPTLRNTDRKPGLPVVKAFAHNGYFKSLEQIVHFYNTRDVKPTCPGPYTADEAIAAGCWPAPEVAENVNSEELGDLGLTPDEEAAVVAFMRTLSDGYRGGD